jgi:hypothetical protein
MTLAENVATLPQSRSDNYEFARFNALRHGVLSQHTLLPWEDGEEYWALLEALVAEHKPQGPTEETRRAPSFSRSPSSRATCSAAAHPF